MRNKVPALHAAIELPPPDIIARTIITIANLNLTVAVLTALTLPCTNNLIELLSKAHNLLKGIGGGTNVTLTENYTTS